MTFAEQRTPNWMAALVLVTLVVGFAAPGAAGQDAGQYFEEAFLGEGESINGPYQLMFGVILPFLLVFAIIHYAMTNMWGEQNQKEATLISLVLAMFPIPTGAYKGIADILQKIGDVISGKKLPEDGFNGIPVLESIFSSSMPAEQQQAIVAVGTGAILALVLTFVGSKGEARELKKHEIAAIILLSAVVWMSMYTGPASNATSNMLNVATFAGILVLGAAMLWAALKHGEGIKGWIAGIAGIGIVGWAFVKIPGDKYFPDAMQEFGNLILSGLMAFAAAIVVIIFVLIIVVVHLGS